MQWKNPKEWKDLTDGVGCAFCSDIHLDENKHSFKAIELEVSIVRIPWNQYYKGWTIVALKNHACELFELPSEELHKFWDEVSRTANAIKEIFNGVKINYNVWGNHIPHIHCHLFVHTFASDPGKLLNPHENEIRLSDSEYLLFKNSLIEKLSN